jgi:hypothetical protein
LSLLHHAASGNRLRRHFFVFGPSALLFDRYGTDHAGYLSAENIDAEVAIPLL